MVVSNVYEYFVFLMIQPVLIDLIFNYELVKNEVMREIHEQKY